VHDGATTEDKPPRAGRMNLASGNAETMEDENPPPTALELVSALLNALPEPDLVRVISAVRPDILERALGEARGPDAAPDDKRKHARRKVLWSAKVIYNDRSCTLDCQIRDISKKGCRIRLKDPVLLPRFFEIVMPDSPEPRPCEVRWRTTNELGVMFVDPPK
jgi:hypothetical protein